jgi:hypothetical protein
MNIKNYYHDHRILDKPYFLRIPVLLEVFGRCGISWVQPAVYYESICGVISSVCFL